MAHLRAESSDDTDPDEESGNNCFDIDLHQQVRTGKAVDDESGAHRENALQMAPDGAVDGFAKCAIGDEGRDLTDILESRSRFLEKLRDVAHRLVGLRRRIAITGEPTVKGGPRLAAQKYSIAGAHRHAETTAKILTVLILCRGFEFAKSLVRVALRAHHLHIDLESTVARIAFFIDSWDIS